MSRLFTSRGQQGAPMRSSTVQPDRTREVHTPAAAARVGQGAVGQGAFAQAGPVFRLTPAPALIQRFPYKYEHTESHRTFHLTKNGQSLVMTQIGDALEAPHSGAAEYHITDKHLVLDKLGSDPEEGSGIGSLLMFYLGQVAEDLGITQVDIPTAAMPAVGFYESVGAKTLNPKVAARREAFFQTQNQTDWVKERHAGQRAKVDYDTNADNRRHNRTFGQLGVDQQNELTEAQEAQFELLGADAKRKIVKDWLHARSVAEQGMAASPADLIDKASKVATRRWRRLDVDFRAVDEGAVEEVAPGASGKSLRTLVSTAGNDYLNDTGLFSRPSKETIDAIQVLGPIVHDYDKLAGAVKWYLDLGIRPDGVDVTAKLKEGSRFQRLLLAAWKEYVG